MWLSCLVVESLCVFVFTNGLRHSEVVPQAEVNDIVATIPKGFVRLFSSHEERVLRVLTSFKIFLETGLPPFPPLPPLRQKRAQDKGDITSEKQEGRRHASLGEQYQAAALLGR